MQQLQLHQSAAEKPGRSGRKREFGEGNHENGAQGSHQGIGNESKRMEITKAQVRAMHQKIAAASGNPKTAVF